MSNYRYRGEQKHYLLFEDGKPFTRAEIEFSGPKEKSIVKLYGDGKDMEDLMYISSEFWCRTYVLWRIRGRIIPNDAFTKEIATQKAQILQREEQNKKLAKACITLSI